MQLERVPAWVESCASHYDFILKYKRLFAIWRGNKETQYNRYENEDEPWGPVDEDFIERAVLTFFFSHPDVIYVHEFLTTAIVDEFFALPTANYGFKEVAERALHDPDYRDHEKFLLPLVKKRGLDKEWVRARFRKEYSAAAEVWPRTDKRHAEHAFVLCTGRRVPDRVLGFALPDRFEAPIYARLHLQCLIECRERLRGLFQRLRRRGLYGGTIGT